MRFYAGVDFQQGVMGSLPQAWFEVTIGDVLYRRQGWAYVNVETDSFEFSVYRLNHAAWRAVREDAAAEVETWRPVREAVADVVVRVRLGRRRWELPLHRKYLEAPINRA